VAEPAAAVAPAARDDAVLTASRSLALFGHPEERWSIVLHGRLSQPLDPAAVAARLTDELAHRPQLGPPPPLSTVPASDLASTLRSLAGAPYEVGGPALRVTLIDAPDPGVVVAAHHGVLDGLGLIALLALALGEPVVSGAKGLKPDAAAGGRFGAFAIRRVTEAMVRPPTRIAGAPHTAGGRGEVMAMRAVPAFSRGAAALTAAAVRAVVGWNREHGAAAPRVAVAIGASERSGASPTLEHRAAWMRILVSSGDDETVAAALRAAPALPVAPPTQRLAGAGRMAARLLSRRLGSTLLMSSLGALTGPPNLHEVAFYPVTHGDRAVALGAATISGRSTITLRGEARDFDAPSLERLLDMLAGELPPEGAR
jgi:hypothetical protein